MKNFTLKRNNVNLAFNTMDLNKKMSDLIAERDLYQSKEDDAHAHVIELNKKIRKLELFQKEALELFGTRPTLFEDSVKEAIKEDQMVVGFPKKDYDDADSGHLDFQKEYQESVKKLK